MKNLHGLGLLWKPRYWAFYSEAVCFGAKRGGAIPGSQIWCLLIMGPAEEAESGSAMSLERKNIYPEPVLNFPPHLLTSLVKRGEEQLKY